jgi:hypothetical protein
MPHKLCHAKGFRERLKFAWFRWQAINGRELTQAELGETIGKILERKEPLDQTTVSRWFSSTVPEAYVIRGLAMALRVDPGWLAFGPDSLAPAPNDPVHDRTGVMDPPAD